MKNLKTIITILISIVVFSSCTLNDLEQPEPGVQKISVTSEVDLVPEVKLVGKRLLTASEIQKERSTTSVDGWYSAPYAESIPIYRYLYYGSYQNIDHYFGASKASSLVVKGVTYSYEHHSFSIMPENNYPDLIALYRHYSSAERDHILTTAPYIASYTSDGVIGYIYMHPQIGTVPLLEYYSSKRRSHHYIVRNTEIDWILEHDPDYMYVKTIGYVYPGSAIDEKKEATRFIITSNFYEEYHSGYFNLKIMAREGDNYWELSYKVENQPGGTSITFLVKNTYTVISCYSFGEYAGENSIGDFTYPLPSSEIFRGKYGWTVKKSINNYDVKLEYLQDVPVGTEH